MNKALFFGGILFLLLPFVLKVWDDRQQSNFVATYETHIKEMEDSKVQDCLDEAYEYNQKLYLTKIVQEDEYLKQLNLFQNGVMGSIEIPKIKLKLPIYHGTEESILTNGIGHLKESSLPIGGMNSHSILTGHRGLPEAQLFTRLDEMKEGDWFYITICEKRLPFQVCRIQVIRPEEVDVLDIEPGKEWVSLVTCTPYGINTHRLVVTGELNEMSEESDVVKTEIFSLKDRIFLFIIGGMLVFGITYHLRKRGK
jgi:sortase A